MSKFEEVCSDQHQMSLARGFPGLTSRGYPTWPFLGGGMLLDLFWGWSTLPCDLSHDAFDDTYPNPHPVNRQMPVKALPSRKGICGW